MKQYTTIYGDESPTDWYECINRDSCGHIGVHPNGSTETCPSCNSPLEKFSGRLFKCETCDTEHIAKEDAQDCCQ